MPALHTPATSTTPTNVHVKAPDVRAHDRQILLILSRDVRVLDRTAAIWTSTGQRHLAALVSLSRRASPTLPAVRRTTLPPTSSRTRRRRALRKWRGLSKAGPSSGLEVFTQPLILATEPIALALELRHALTERLVLLTKGFGGGDGRRFARMLRRHTDVMSHLDLSYKSHLVPRAQTR